MKRQGVQIVVVVSFLLACTIDALSSEVLVVHQNPALATQSNSVSHQPIKQDSSCVVSELRSIEKDTVEIRVATAPETMLPVIGDRRLVRINSPPPHCPSTR
ncbi:MAG: hypothetical protein AB1733_16110 [Thermodesulfobacteriota bacterium]